MTADANQKIRLGISSCLLGYKVRYDGDDKLEHFLTDTIGQYVEWVPVCPEVESGLSVPREAMRLVGAVDDPRLVTIRTGVDHTDRIKTWASKKMTYLNGLDLCGFVFKSRSPSSGMRGVKVSIETGKISTTGSGIFAKAFLDHFPHLPAEDEERLHDPSIRENFIERVFVYQRWQDYRRQDGSLGGLIAFHTGHKYLIMAHSQKHSIALGKMVAGAKSGSRKEILDRYIATLMAGLSLIATVKKNTNVLQHMAGYFKKSLCADEKKELESSIGNYHDHLVPLIVPITLLKHFVRKYQVAYLAGQIYLSPHPLEIMLRNHV